MRYLENICQDSPKIVSLCVQLVRKLVHMERNPENIENKITHIELAI
jgi:hypothetical protein